jgi:hypothetical protein
MNRRSWFYFLTLKATLIGAAFLSGLFAGELDPPQPSGTEADQPKPLNCTGKDGVSFAQVRRSQEAWASHLGRK